jgi:cardiolipin synthase (CMP-forming)
MTLANKITVTRLCLVPVFAVAAFRYGHSISNGLPDERWRAAAAGIFALAAVTDVLDGWMARRLNQRTRLGSILDPIADKGLIATGILVIIFGHWPDAFPGWFAMAVLGRDLLLAIGFLVLVHFSEGVTVRPSSLGKFATVLQVAAILWVLIGIPLISPSYPAALAASFTLVSGAGYVLEALRQTKSANQKRDSSV